jgi:hypothetical protein
MGCSPTHPGQAPTLIFELPLFQFSLNLVQHHGQLPKDLLQVAHIVMFQDLGLQVEEWPRARG